MSELKSKMFSAVSHSGDTLTVTLHNGSVYHHDGVSAELHAAMMAAPSAGAFYNAQVKKNHPARKA